MDANTLYWGLATTGGIFLLGNFLYKKNRKRKKELKYEKMKPLDQREMEELTKTEWAKKEFQERLIHHKIHLFREAQNGEVICIKISNQKVRIGKLAAWAMSTNRFNTIMITPQGEKPVFGVETGFFFTEIPIAEFENWQLGITQWESFYVHKCKRQLTYYSLDEYLTKVNELVEITGY